MARTSSGFAGLFPRRDRVAGLAWAAVTIPSTTALAALADGRDAYLFVLVFLASGAYTTPALVVGWLVVRRVEPAERPAAALWLASVVLMYAIGLGVLAGLALDTGLGNPAGAPAVATIAALVLAGNVCLVRNGSGERAVVVDIVDCLTWAVVAAAPCALLWADDIVTADEAWLAVPAALSAVGMLAGTFWMALLVTRRGDHPTLSAFLLAFTLLGTLDAVLQAAQALSGFALPAPPLVAVHATCMALMLLVPLHVPRRPAARLGDLAPHRQVRGGTGAALLPLAGLPAIVLTAVVAGDGEPWAAVVCVGAITALAALVAARQALVQRETRHLYGRLELAATRRRELLGALVRNTHDDRHRIATTFHRHAVSAYVGIATFLRAAEASPAAPAGAASGRVKDDLARHVDALRDLVAAPAPRPDRVPAHPLAVLAAAHHDNLYDDTPAPRLDVTVAEGLTLEWEVEAALVRIVQEALDDVARRGGATAVSVALDAFHATLVLTVTDDGADPDEGDHAPGAARADAGGGPPRRSPVATMRHLTAPLGGTVDVHRPPGRGTTVTARLDPGMARTSPDWRPPPRLRSVPNG